MKKLLERLKDALYGVLPWLLLFGIPIAIIVNKVYYEFSDHPKRDEKEIRTYDTGYEDGKSIGKEIGYENGYDDGHSKGYDEGYFYGYEDGHDEVDWVEDEAGHYARKKSGWTPEEAWMLIDAYQNQEPWYEDGSLPSEQDYLDAINSLIYFYDYFFNKRYE